MSNYKWTDPEWLRAKANELRESGPKARAAHEADYQARRAKAQAIANECAARGVEPDLEDVLVFRGPIPGGSMITIPPDAMDEIANEIIRLRAIVDQLPKTADGVPLSPGMEVWFDTGGGYIESGRLDAFGVTVFAGGDQNEFVELESCHSSRESAMGSKAVPHAG